MAGGIWDSNLKQLVTATPQDFVSWLLPDAQVVRELSEHLNRSIDVDLSYEVSKNNECEIFHLEIQRYRDVDMSERVWEYNVLTTCKYHLTVMSFVLYLKKDGIIAESPYMRNSTLYKAKIHNFYFVNIKLWEIPTEELRSTGLIGLLPLLPLTREGAKPEVVEEVVEKLEHMEDITQFKSLLSITLTLASLALDKPGEKHWLIRRFKMYQDIMRDSEIYQLIAQEGAEKALQQEIQNLRSLILGLIQSCFPELQVSASATITSITSKDTLNDLILSIGAAKTVKEAQQLLAKAGKQPSA